MRVLIAEDDAPLLSVLTRGLRQNGYVVDTAARGDDALHLLMVNEYAAAVLDWRMPGLNGIEVIAAVRQRRQTLPILLLTAHDAPADRVRGLDAGADDYVVKPFDFSELLARLRALLRRGSEGGSAVLRLGNLALDPATRDVRIGDRDLGLTPREYGILELLLRRAGTVVSRQGIIDQVWPEGDPTWNAIDVHVARLRAKMAGGSTVHILAVRGAGYRLVES
jgi:DNA-binding response OmpR family regulator